MGEKHESLKPILSNVASALCFVHQQKIIHRDVKESNILFKNVEKTEVLQLNIVPEKITLFGPPPIRSTTPSAVFGRQMETLRLL